MNCWKRHIRSSIQSSSCILTLGHVMWAGSRGYLPGEASEYYLCPSLFFHLSLLPHPTSFKICELDWFFLYTMFMLVKLRRMRCTQNSSWSSGGRRSHGRPRLDVTIILEWILDQWGVKRCPLWMQDKCWVMIFSDFCDQMNRCYLCEETLWHEIDVGKYWYTAC